MDDNLEKSGIGAQVSESAARRTDILRNFYHNFKPQETHIGAMNLLGIIESPVFERTGSTSAVLGRCEGKNVVMDSKDLSMFGEMRIVRSTDGEQYGLYVNHYGYGKSYLLVFPPEGGASREPGIQSPSLKEYLVSLADVVATGMIETYGVPREVIETLQQNLDMGSRVHVLTYLYRLGYFSRYCLANPKWRESEGKKRAQRIADTWPFANFDDPIEGKYCFRNGSWEWAQDTGLFYMKGDEVKHTRSREEGDSVRTPTEMDVHLLRPFNGRYHPAIGYDTRGNPYIGRTKKGKMIELDMDTIWTMRINLTSGGRFNIYVLEEHFKVVRDVEFPPEKKTANSQNEKTLNGRDLDWYMRSVAVLVNGMIYERWGDAVNIALAEGLDLSNSGHVMTLLGRQALFIVSYIDARYSSFPFIETKAAARAARGPVVEDVRLLLEANDRTLSLSDFPDWELGESARLNSSQVASDGGEVPIHLPDAGSSVVDEIHALKAAERSDLEMTAEEVRTVCGQIRDIERRYRSHLLGETYSFPPHSRLAHDLDLLRKIIADPGSAETSIQLPMDSQIKKENIQSGRLFRHYVSEFKEPEPIPDGYGATIREESVRLASVLFRKMAALADCNVAASQSSLSSERNFLSHHAPLRALIDGETGEPLIDITEHHYKDLYSAYWELFPHFDQTISGWTPVENRKLLQRGATYDPNAEIIRHAEFLELICNLNDPLLRAPFPGSIVGEKREWGITMFGQQMLPGRPLKEVLPIVAGFMRIIATNSAIRANNIEQVEHRVPGTKLQNKKVHYERLRDTAVQNIAKRFPAIGRENAQSFIDALKNMKYISTRDGISETKMLSSYYGMKEVIDRLQQELDYQ